MSYAELQVKKVSKMGRRQARSWACETGMPLEGKRHKKILSKERGDTRWAWHARLRMARRIHQLL
ncbi:hypothetical protein AHAS_Ahas04G0108400 [Arachis hypogaea]